MAISDAMTPADMALLALEAHAAAIAAGDGTSGTPSGDNAAEALSALRSYRASFIYDRDLGCHIASCSRLKRHKNGAIAVCGNGPLTGEEAVTGECTDPHTIHVEPPEWHIGRW